MSTRKYAPNPRLDLVMERIVDVPREIVWKAWTRPEHLKRWFTPAPWSTAECEIDLRPGGIFRTVICSPDGEKHPTSACYLEIVENEKLVWTDALERDYRPSAKPNDCFGKHFTAVITFEPRGNGTKYTVVVLHSDEECRKLHEERGFHDGWGAALDQLVDLAKRGAFA